MTRFKDKDMQQFYDGCRTLAADRTSEFWCDGRPRRGASHRGAYWDGRGGIKPVYIGKGTLAYAAWAAGRDDRKQFGPVAEWQVRWIGNAGRSGDIGG